MKSCLKENTFNFKNLSTRHSENLCRKKVDDGKENQNEIVLISQACRTGAKAR